MVLFELKARLPNDEKLANLCFIGKSWSQGKKDWCCANKKLGCPKEDDEKPAKCCFTRKNLVRRVERMALRE